MGDEDVANGDSSMLAAGPMIGVSHTVEMVPPTTVTRKEFRKFAYSMISNKRYNSEADAKKIADMFYRMADPGWWDKSLVGYISTKCLKALGN